MRRHHRQAPNRERQEGVTLMLGDIFAVLPSNGGQSTEDGRRLTAR
jgi:hypothetical protein